MQYLMQVLIQIVWKFKFAIRYDSERMEIWGVRIFFAIGACSLGDILVARKEFVQFY